MCVDEVSQAERNPVIANLPVGVAPTSAAERSGRCSRRDDVALTATSGYCLIVETVREG